ncbi:rod shape-determining protein MreC [Atopostipes suicloacalis DSM 15692]|uniref:Cell shape-determining protein MreC n=1 Tax=Atopostipes suicloacalis DSM 15692 TaxID=1121025 RepID=A0A1M4T2V0_9LACT|nr:rod shape-determining protein MreC [Atopostipes suicloacalis]SHE38724.1 rod shape-determining protein MreC [Atopostipes suicloacalis DSM 15692]
MKQYFNNKKLITLLVSLMFFIGILWYSFNNFGSAPYIQQVVNDITSVAGRVISKPVNALNGLFSDINNLQNTFEENKELKAKLDELATMQAELTTVTSENQKLQEELDLQATLTDYNTISGTVIARNPDKWIDQVVIDRGNRDGLVNGMSVMSNNGLVGRVVEVNPTSSKVTLLTTNDEAAVYTSAEIALEDETLFGVINGYDTNRKALIMEQITSTSTIEEGATVTSSGLGGLVPKGLLIGTVSEVSLDRHGLGQRVYIEPATNFEDIRFVTIINREAETVDKSNHSADTEEESE